MNRIAIILACFLGCGGGKSTEKHVDAPSNVDAFESTCGQPGDQGNEKGIGKFCTSFNDCANTNDAPLCSIIGDSTTHFCTKTCTNGGPADQCGTATQCVCNSSNQCGCTPTACL